MGGLLAARAVPLATTARRRTAYTARRTADREWNIASSPSEFQRFGPARLAYEELTVAHAAGTCDADNTVGHVGSTGVAHPHGDFNLRQEGHAVLAAHIAIEVAF